MKTIKYIVLSVVLSFLLSPSLFASGSLSGFCEIGNKIVYTSNLPSTTKVQQSYPSCTVTVYIYGTTTKATLYSDNSSTPLANPFTATTNGYWSFFAANEIYSVVLSNGGITAPFTLGPYTLVDSATAGTVTGSGTTNTIPVWASSTSLGNSNIVQSSSTTATVTDTVVVTKNLIANSASAAPITGSGQAIVAGNQAKFVASSTTANSANQSLIEMYSTGSKSVIDSTAAGAGTVLPVEIQFAEVTAIQFPITGGFDMPTSATGVSAANHGRLKYNSSTQTFQVSVNGGAYESLFTGSVSGITGSGTTNSIPVFTGSTAIGSSSITQPSSVSINLAAASIAVGDTAAPTPLTTGGLVIAIGSGGKMIASNTTTSTTNQSLLEFYNNGTYSIIDSTAANAGVVKPISIQFAEVEAIQFPITGGFDMPSSATGVSAASHGRLRYSSSAQAFQISENGAAYVSIGASSGWTLNTGSSILYPTTTTDTVIIGDTTSLSSLDARYTGATIQNINTTQKHNTLITFSNTAGIAPELDLIHSRGTHASPTNVQSGDTLGILAFGGKNSDGINESGLITGSATANWTTGPTNNPTKLSMWTTPVNSGIPVRRLDLLETGQMVYDPTDTLAGGTAAIAIHPAGNGIGFATYEAITSNSLDTLLELYAKRSTSRTLLMTLDGTDSTTQTGLSLFDHNGVLARVLIGDCTVAGGTHKCLYFD